MLNRRNGHITSTYCVQLAWCLNSVLNVKAVVAAFNQEKALVGAFSVITNLRMDLFEALIVSDPTQPAPARPPSRERESRRE